MLFSVVIPVFNSSDYILDTLKSVQSASSSLDYEIILVDDCSKDIDRLKKVLQGFDNTILIEKDKKTNAANSRNIGILKSKGRYVFLLDSDDHFVPGSIDRRIYLHEESKAGIIFGNFITKSCRYERKSNLPNYQAENMRDYIFIKKGDFRSSVVSISKKYYKDTLFDDASQKHQDWIFAFRCWDSKEVIQFDKKTSTILNVNRAARMSSSSNINASKYLCQEYLDNPKHINGFAENHWNSMIYDEDHDACDFFTNVYKPQKSKEYFKLAFYKFISNRAVLPFSSIGISTLRAVKTSRFVILKV